MTLRFGELFRRAISTTNTWVISLGLCTLFIIPFSWAEEDLQAPLLERIHLSDVSGVTPSQTALPLLRQSMMLSLQPTFFTPLVTPGRLKDVVPDSAALRSKGLSASSAWLDGKLKADSEVAFLDSTQPSWGPQQDSGRRMWRLTVNGMEGAFRYGASYRTAGKAYINAPNQSLREVWGEYVFGVARLRSSVGQTWNNVAGDPALLRLTQTYGRLGLALTRPQWPELTLTYTRASMVNALLSGGTPSQDAATDTVAAMLAYTRPLWQLQLASSYLMSDNRLAGARNTTGLLESFTASYRPWNTFSVTSSIGYRGDFDQWSGAHLQTPSGSLSLNYRASQHCYISALGGYSITHSNDGTTDVESVNSRALLAWTFPTMAFTGTPPTVAIEASYTLTAAHAAAPTDLQDVSGLVRLVIEEF